MKKLLSVLLIAAMLLSLAACGSTNGDANTSDAGSASGTESPAPVESTDKLEEDRVLINIKVGATVLTAILDENSSAKAFAELLEQGEITVEMRDYGSLEKVGPLPQSIVRNDETITTEPGDVILYQGNRIVIYYDTNTYSFTRLGKIAGVSQEELKSLLGDGNVSVTFCIHKEAPTKDKVLVAYFSASGTTKRLAEYAVDLMDADLYEIVPAEPYTSDDLKYNNSDCRANREMEDETCRPKISGGVENMADYDIVFIGYPIWWGEAPRILSTFVESYDFSGKTVVTFCTSGSSPNNDSAIKALARGANWISGMRLNGNSSQSDIADWINGLDIDIEVRP